MLVRRGGGGIWGNAPARQQTTGPVCGTRGSALSRARSHGDVGDASRMTEARPSQSSSPAAHRRSQLSGLTRVPVETRPLRHLRQMTYARKAGAFLPWQGRYQEGPMQTHPPVVHGRVRGPAHHRERRGRCGDPQAPPVRSSRVSRKRPQSHDCIHRTVTRSSRPTQAPTSARSLACGAHPARKVAPSCPTETCSDAPTVAPRPYS